MLKKPGRVLIILSIILLFAGFAMSTVLAASLPNEQGTYYLPDGLNDVRDFTILDSNLYVTSRASNGSVFVLIYEMGKSHLLGVYHLMPVTPDEIVNEELAEEAGTYYLPDGLTDVRSVKVTDTELLVASKAEKGDVITSGYTLGQSYPTSFSVFQSTDIAEIDSGNLPQEQGVYYLPDGLTDVRDMILLGSEVALISRASVGVVMSIYTMGVSDPSSFAIFEPTDPADIEDNSLPQNKGTYYLPDGLLDIRSAQVIDDEIIITSKAEQGDVFMMFYNGGVSNPTSFAVFEATNPDRIEDMPQDQGTYYLPDGLTDVRRAQIIDSRILILSRAEKGDVFMVIYDAGDSSPQGFAHFKQTPPEQCFE
ncbi:MAG: hypothetical protein UMV23_00675 [Halanaerobium sp.]|nr:hypothetical protein [Halanaerobium sp.]